MRRGLFKVMLTARAGHIFRRGHDHHISKFCYGFQRVLFPERKFIVIRY